MKKSQGSVLDGGLSNEAVEKMKQNGRKRLGTAGGRPKGGAPRPKSKAKRERLFAELEVEVFQQGMTVEQAMELCGWTVVEDGPFHLRDANGAKVRMLNNSTNRPFRLGLAMRYMSEFLRNKWKLNGETIILDWLGQVQSGQHRLAGFILAEQMRRLDKPVKKGGQTGWKDACKVHWKRGGPLTLAGIVVKGIDPAPEVVDTLDLGQKRTMGDVFFREERFASGLLPGTPSGKKAGVSVEGDKGLASPPVSEVVRRKLCNILSYATRLVWLRAGGRSVSDAPHFPHSEALDFISSHPRLEESVLYIWGLEGGAGKAGGLISRYVALGTAAGLHYLMMTSGTDPDEFVRDGAAAVEFSMEKKAREFWAKFASGAKLEESDPIHVLRQTVGQVDAGSGVGRDEVIGMIINAFNLWAEKLKATARDITMRKEPDDLGKLRLTTVPRLGGVDVQGPEQPEHLDIERVEDTREGSMSSMANGRKRPGDPQGWSEGDTAWVRCQDGEHWFGTIDEIIKRSEKDGGSSAMLSDADTGKQYEESFKVLSLVYPG